MGLFDTIERLNYTEGHPPPTRPRAQLLPRPSLKVAKQDQHQHPTKENKLDVWTASPTELEERRRILNLKPECLSFLAPCPVCLGRAFLQIDGGGFVCRTCQPSLFGYPVEATGPDQQAPVMDKELLPASESGEQPTPQPSTGRQPTEDHGPFFAAAWPWIKDNKAVLIAAGWTMAALVGRAKFRWPAGPWGLAWMPVWSKPGVVFSLGQRGEISFVFSSSGRIITQTAQPPPGKKMI